MSRLLYDEDQNLIEWHDDETRTHHDYRSGVDVTRPYTDDENEIADQLAAQAAQDATAASVREQARAYLELSAPTSAQRVDQIERLSVLLLEVLDRLDPLG